MKLEKFKVSDWLNQPSETQDSPTIPIVESEYDQVESLVNQILRQSVDITIGYENWRNIGFALADSFGENGRSLYHQLSSAHSEYSNVETDKQFDACLKSNGHGINLGTLYYLAKQAGVTFSKDFVEKQPTQKAKTKAPEPKRLPNFPESIFSELPVFFKKITCVGKTNDEKDLLLIGSLVALSVTLPTVYGVYHDKKHFANLYLFVSAQASAGKGRLNHLRKLVKPIHDSYREEYKKAKTVFEFELNNYNAQKKKNSDLEKPESPPMKLLFLPANNSSSGVFQLLNDNEGRGLIFETEGDTLANTFKSDFGNYSDGFRKAFHHETISFYRRTDREYVDLESPCLSAVLSGTPMQIQNLIPNAEDGLFSRFIFYYLNMNHEWLDVFANTSSTGLDEYFFNLGVEYLEFYNALLAHPSIRFELSPKQQTEFNIHFQKVFNKYFSLKGEDYIGTIRRLGLITFRIAMIFTAFRMMDTGELQGTLVCSDVDFSNALKLSEVLLVHSSYIFSQMPETAKPVKRLNKKESFFESLPEKFSRKEYLEVAASLNIQDKTAQYYIASFKSAGLLYHPQKNEYEKAI